ncbi:hypothetical protein BH09VER1_BH09VER1_18220 [soil metagenome]
MRLSILCDIHWESRVDLILNELPDYRERFESRDYGRGLNCIAVILMCRNPELNFKRRIKLKNEKGAFREEKVLYMDIMLDLPTMSAFDRTDRGSRRKIIAQRLYDEVPEVLSRYKIADFERDAFIADFRSWIDELDWR